MVEEREDNKEETKEESVRDTLEAVMAEAEEPKEEAPVDTETEEEPKEEEPEEKAPEGTEDEVVPEEEDLEDQEDVQEEEAQESLSAPDSWSSTDRKVFSKLPRDAQEIVARRDREANNYLTNKGREIAEYKRELEGALSHYQDVGQVLAKHGRGKDTVLDAHYLDAVLAGDRALQSQDRNTQVNAAWRVLESVGLHPEDLLDDNVDYNSPVYDELQGEVSTLREQNDQLLQSFQQQQYSSANEQAKQFAFEKDENGEFIRPFFHDPLLRDNLVQIMAAEVSALKQANPQATPYELYNTAYDKVIWTIPEIRENLVAPTPKASKKNGIKANKQKVEQAKKMSSSIKSSATKTQPPKKADTVRAALEAAWDEHS